MSSTDIKKRISTMGYLFVIEEILDHSISSIDNTLLKADSCVWHKSSIKKGIVPHSGIDIGARWDYGYTKGWIFGYKLHLTSTTAEDIIIPLTADVTTANVPDNKMYVTLTSSSFVFSLPSLRYMVADPGYDAKGLYEYNIGLGIDLVCPVERYRNTPKKRLELVCFYETEMGQTIYNQRKISIDPS